MQVSSFETGPLHDLGQDRLLSPAEIQAEAAARAAGLAAAGVGAGSYVLLSHGNSWQFLCDLLALWHLGACAIPVDPALSPPELANLLSHSEARHVLYRAGAAVAALQAAAPEVSWLDSDSLPVTGAAWPAGGLELDAPALLLYTSGSTGEPKGVVHSHRSLQARLVLLADHVPLARLSHSLNLLPTHFGHGLICNCLYPWLGGQKLFLLPAFSLATVSLLGELIDRHRISFLSSVPSLWRLALRVSRPPKGGSLELVHCGSAPLSADLRAHIQEWCGTLAVRNTYGITETGSWLAGSSEPAEHAGDGYIGPVWGGELRVVDAEGKTLPAGEPGLVLVRTPALMTGYHKRPDLTAGAVVQGWFITGDIGSLDARGHLTLVGRQRHEINKGGLKVWPEDVDLALERHPEIAEACTFAIEDPVAGQNIAAAVVPKSTGFDLDALRAWLAGQLSPHKHPIRWFVVESIPRSSRGKVNRDAVAKALLEAPVPVPPPAAEPEPAAQPDATSSEPDSSAPAAPETPAPDTPAPDTPASEPLSSEPVPTEPEVTPSDASPSQPVAGPAETESESEGFTEVVETTPVRPKPPKEG